MSRFVDALRSGRVLLMDGAMGTELQRAGLKPGECGELWNLTHPEKVRAIHQAYVDAGAEVLLTNTFQANPAALSVHGLHSASDKIQKAGVALARASEEPGHFICFSIGPLNKSQLPAAVWTPDYVHDFFRNRGNAQGFLLETFSDNNALSIGRLLKQSGSPSDQVPVLVSLTYHRNLGQGVCTFDRHTPEEWAREANRFADALGVNCGRDIGMDDVIEIIRRYRQETDLPLFVRPNAGTPTNVSGEWIYPHSPEAMAARLPDLLKAGVSMVGGCCGTTPAHIAAFKPIVDTWNARNPL